MSALGDARAVVYLDESFENRPMTVAFRGWHAGDGRLREDLPPGVRLQFPTRLPPSDAPIVPILVHGETPPTGLAVMVLSFSVEGGERAMELTLSVELPKVVIFEMDAPDRAVAFPDRPTAIPVTVRNHGNVSGRAVLSFSGVAANAPSMQVAPGRSAVLNVELPPMSSGERSFTITLNGGTRPVSRLIQLRTPSAAPSDRYGLVATLAAEASGLLGAEQLLSDTAFSLSVQGRLSRLTYIEAAAVVDPDAPDTLEPRLLLRYRGTIVELDDHTRSSPTGDVGRAVYLTQQFTGVPVVDSLTFGAALPLEQEDASPRLGVLLDGARIHTQVALDISADDLAAEARANLAPFHVSLRYADSEAIRWQGRVNYAARAFGADFVGEIGRDGVSRLSLGSRYGTTLSGLGPTTFSARLEVGDLSFRAANLRASVGKSRFGLLAASGDLGLEAEHAFSVGNASLTLAGTLPLRGSGEAAARLGATVPAGPLMLELGANWSGSGNLDVELGAAYTALLRSGSLSGALTLLGADLLHEPRIDARAVAAFAGRNGLGASLGVQAPIRGPGSVEFGLGLSYSAFLATPDGLARILDGPDPTVRQVLVQLTAGDTSRPLAGVRLLGCGQPADSGEDGLATLRGPPGPCQVTVDPSTLPPDAVLREQENVALPGQTLVIDVLPTSTLRGEVRYRDQETGEALRDGPARDMRVLVQGPVARWTTVHLPGGSFELRGLPVGDYLVRLPASSESTTVVLGPAGTTVELTTPAPRRRVLDPAAITPPVRLDLQSLLVTADEPIRITIQSPAAISRVTLELGANQAVVEPAPAAGLAEPWRLELPLPPTPGGAARLNVTVEFTQGQVAERTLQLVVVGEPATDVLAGGQWRARKVDSPVQDVPAAAPAATPEAEAALPPSPEADAGPGAAGAQDAPAAPDADAAPVGAHEGPAPAAAESEVVGEARGRSELETVLPPAQQPSVDEDVAGRARAAAPELDSGAADSPSGRAIPYGLDPEEFVLLPGSDGRISFRSPAAVVPPGVTVSLYVTSEKPIERIRVTNLRYLQSYGEVELLGQPLRRVLTISPIDAVGTIQVPVEVTFTDGTVENRIVTFEVDRYAPVPIIPGHNVPLSP
jgi:hypothetical protein